jgi:hypothetical protein
MAIRRRQRIVRRDNPDRRAEKEIGSNQLLREGRWRGLFTYVLRRAKISHRKEYFFASRISQTRQAGDTCHADCHSQGSKEFNGQFSDAAARIPRPPPRQLRNYLAAKANQRDGNALKNPKSSAPIASPWSRCKLPRSMICSLTRSAIFSHATTCFSNADAPLSLS